MSLLEVELIPILNDNYVFVLKNKTRQTACMVDPGDASPCLDYLKKNDLHLETILITHHHFDHIGGVRGLCDAFPEAQVYGPSKNRGQISPVHHWVREKDLVFISDPQHSAKEKDGFEDKFLVIELPGHTLGHVAYYHAKKKWLFSGDVLFGLGCGRLFEGSPSVAFHSLKKLKTLPPETLVFCTHEYTQANLEFTEHLIETKQIPSGFQVDEFSFFKMDFFNKRVKGKHSVPLVLGDEMRWNVFLLSETVDEFARLRMVRNVF